MELYYDYLHYETHRFLIVCSVNGLSFVGTPDADLEELDQFIRNAQLIKNAEHVGRAKDQITEYFNGTRKKFSLPLDAEFGTPLQQKVWRTLPEIPYGQTITYKELAAKVGHPKAIRAVASAVGRNPWMLVAPCHRVMRSDHGLGGFRGGLPLKRALLKMEQDQQPVTF
ncbi:methylated-DNA--[protein]-cysteine S-methyltransferase [Paucilactobacillus sp. N302-9]